MEFLPQQDVSSLLKKQNVSSLLKNVPSSRIEPVVYRIIVIRFITDSNSGNTANTCNGIGRTAIPALAGTLGGTIMAMMGVFLGLVWYYQRKLQKLFI